MTPEWLEPMAATLTQERFTDDAWIFEQKLDGIRLLAFKDGDDVRLLTRNRRPRHLPHVADAIARLPVDEIVLDGESTWSGECEPGAATAATAATAAIGGGPIASGDPMAATGFAYHVFDILWLDGRDVTALPLVERYKLLDGLMLAPPLGRVARCSSAQPWEHACSEGWEGVIAKRLDAPYEHRRSKNWLKMKCEVRQRFVVGGFTDPQNSRVGLGALLVGYYDGDDLVYAGKVGTGFDTAMLLALRARLDASAIATPPFTKAVGLPRVREHWVRPEIVVDVAFIEWTTHGKLRHSRLLGVCDGASPRDVVRTS